jgi:hypothetical protein
MNGVTMTTPGLAMNLVPLPKLKYWRISLVFS